MQQPQPSKSSKPEKMFTALPLHPFPAFQSSHYAPAVSSPLSSSPLRTSPISPRDTHGDLDFCAILSSPTPSRNAWDERIMEEREVMKPVLPKREAFSKRQVRKNPLLNKGDDGRETRRKLFLRRVREDSEDKRWEMRGGDDEMMRTIWMAEQRRREGKLAREAQLMPSTQEEEEPEEFEESPQTSSLSQIEEMADQVAQQEDAEMDALLQMFEADTLDKSSGQYNDPGTPYGSDDDEYDRLFMEVITDETTSGPPLQASRFSERPDEDMMDMS